MSVSSLHVFLLFFSHNRNEDKELPIKYTPILINTVYTSPLFLALSLSLYLSASLSTFLSVSLQFKGCQILPKPIRVYVRSSGGPCGDSTGYGVARGLKRQSQFAVFNNFREEQQQQAINQPWNSEQTLTCWIWGDKNSGWLKAQETHIQNHTNRGAPNKCTQVCSEKSL